MQRAQDDGVWIGQVGKIPKPRFSALRHELRDEIRWMYRLAVRLQGREGKARRDQSGAGSIRDPAPAPLMRVATQNTKTVRVSGCSAAS